MDLENFKKALNQLGIQYETDVKLATFTTWKIGGPADVFIRLKDPKSLKNLLQSAHNHQVPVSFLGGGSNVLINDAGIRGLTIKNELSGIFLEGSEETSIDFSESIKEPEWTEEPKALEARLLQIDTKDYYDFAAIDYDESNTPTTKVAIYSGTNLAYAINNLISQGVTGLQWFAGIPGTIGGAIYNNIHGGRYFFSQFIEGIEICNSKGEIKILDKSSIKFDYDYSGLQQGNDFIIKGLFHLHLGDKAKAQQAAINWARIKQTKQPYNTAGCCFKNLSLSDQERLELLSNSWGYINDKILNLKGKTIGGAKISEKHAAFIENTGNANSQDVLDLLSFVYDKAANKFTNCTPKTEIFFLGFKKEEIQKFL